MLVPLVKTGHTSSTAMKEKNCRWIEGCAVLRDQEDDRVLIASKCHTRETRNPPSNRPGRLGVIV
jgi:hypothetical protein